ncbi:hypothetical protein BDA99DRAFT_508314 [Phascolomyces articulosus]|uniref:Uncharacterized protein n=1 Tax=Phascolomyces articulosus TaxID=60185 RepID=A0AAD5KA81_9FUNG|nr:hypothetical protein BDA99DRAFT_508314 [Phascolomyces articulosus]
MMKMVMITMVRRHNFSIIERGSCKEKNAAIRNRMCSIRCMMLIKYFPFLWLSRTGMTVIFIYIGKRKKDNGSNMDWRVMMVMIMEQGMCYHGFFNLFIF